MRRIAYTSELFEEDGQVVALCPELNVSSYGNTSTEALDSLKEAVELFLDECGKLGTLDMILEEAGYRREPGGSDRWIHRQPIQVNRLEAAVA